MNSNQEGHKKARRKHRAKESVSLDASWWIRPWQAEKESDPDEGWDRPASDTPWHESHGLESFTSEEIFKAVEYEYEELRSRERVRELAEVFTHQREVDAMLNLFPDAFSFLDIKFLEPACGSGNFIVEILRRKLKLVIKSECASQQHYEFRLLRAVASIYGVDISAENITEVRARVANEILGYFQNDCNTVEPSIGFLSCLNLIISENFLLGDSLNSANQIVFTDWRPTSGGYFQRIQSCALVPETERDLFWTENTLDKDPVHYQKLGKLDKTRSGSAKKRDRR